MLDFAFEKFDILHPGLALIFAGQRQHFIRHIEAVGFARGADTPRRKQHIDTAARAEIDPAQRGMEARAKEEKSGEALKDQSPPRNKDRIGAEALSACRL